MSFLKLLVFLVCFWFIGVFCYKQTDGFTTTSIDQFPSKNAFSFPYISNAKDTVLAKTTLAQPFYYLGKGGQSYAFVSQDGKTVLKLFKRRHGFSDQAIFWLDAILPQFLKADRARLLQTRQERFGSIFQSCFIADTQLRERTGLLYLHLEPTKHQLCHVTISDRLGIQHIIDLDQTPFLLQKKADLILPVLRQSLATNNIHAAQQLIQDLIDYIYQRSLLGIGDDDRALRRNYGVIDGKACSIDVGSFVYKPILRNPAHAAKEVALKTHRLNRLLKRNCPKLLIWYQEILMHLIKKNEDLNERSTLQSTQDEILTSRI